MSHTIWIWFESNVEVTVVGVTNAQNAAWKEAILEK